MHRQYVWIATAGLVAMTSLSMAGGAAQAEPLANSAAAPTSSGNEWLGRLVLIAVAAAAAGAFTALQLRAWSGRRRSGSGRSRDTFDWRTLPQPPHEDEPGPGEMPFGQQESYGPLWRYGAPRGYRRDYEPGCEPARGPGYGRDSDASPGPGDSRGPAGRGSGPGRSSGSGYHPGFGPGARLPWGVPEDVPRDRRP
jgi:hypothetical protein